jgi:hypothetical protein
VVCEECWLVQLSDVVDPRSIFEDYAYFSSISDSWLQHSERYANAMAEQLGLGPKSLVLEVASNDGYLLRAFQQRGVGVLGIEPARNVAATAMENGVPTVVEFLTPELAQRLVAEGVQPQLITANNVLAHVPDIRGFVSALDLLMSETTVLTVEFPHLLNLLTESQFDTIYHEHYSYLSLTTVDRLFSVAGLVIVDVEELPTHGGSLRVYARKSIAGSSQQSEAVRKLLATEQRAGLTDLETYVAFADKTERAKYAFTSFLERARNDGLSVAAYGAAAKGNTLLNTCGVTDSLISFVVDRSPHKQGLFLPGSRLPILDPRVVFEREPSYLVVLPWNLADEIMEQMSQIRDWGGRFVIPIPSVQVLA